MLPGAIRIGPFTGLRHLLFGPDGPLVPTKPMPVNPFVRNGRALVAIVGGRDATEMVPEAVRLLGGLGPLAVQGKTVLVKPNVLAGDPPPVTTSPEVVASTVRLLREAGAARVLVGDRSAITTMPTRKNFKDTGLDRAAIGAGAEVLSFEDHDWVRIEPEGARYATRYWVAKAVYEADLLINLPVVKTHRKATYSICLKNLVGVVHPRNTPWVMDKTHWEEVIAELNLGVHPHLHIVDAMICLVARGPWHGPTRRANLILASGDRLAAEVVGLALLKSFGEWPRVADVGVWTQRQVRRAVELGLGVSRPEEIELVSAALDGAGPGFPALVERLSRLIET